jgi:hypothetical protein
MFDENEVTAGETKQLPLDHAPVGAFDQRDTSFAHQPANGTPERDQRGSNHYVHKYGPADLQAHHGEIIHRL